MSTPIITLANTHYANEYYEKDTLANNTKSHVFLNNIKLATINNNDSPYFVIGDHLNSSSLLVKSDGNIAEVSDYDPYGNIVYNDVNVDVSNDYTFTGREYDDENGLQYFGARYLDNNIGKLVSIDPAILIFHDNSQLKKMTNMELQDILANPQRLNSYSYALNNPVILIDDNGEFVHVIIGAGAAVLGQYIYDVGKNISNDGFNAKAFTNVSSAETYAVRAGQGALIALTGGAAAGLGLGLVGQGAVVGAASGVTGALGNAYLGEEVTPQSVVADTVIGGLSFGAMSSVAKVPGRLPKFGTEAFLVGKHTQQSASTLAADAMSSYLGSLYGNTDFSPIDYNANIKNIQTQSNPLYNQSRINISPNNRNNYYQSTPAF